MQTARANPAGAVRWLRSAAPDGQAGSAGLQTAGARTTDRAVRQAQQKRCGASSSFRRRGAPEQFSAYRLHSLSVSDEADSMPASSMGDSEVIGLTEGSMTRTLTQTHGTLGG